MPHTPAVRHFQTSEFDCGFSPCFTRLAFGTHEATHVLHHPDDGQLDFLTESDLFPDVLERHFLFGVGWEDRTGSQLEAGGSSFTTPLIRGGHFVIVANE